MQKILFGRNELSSLKSLGSTRPLLVCDPFFMSSELYPAVAESFESVTPFSGFSPNPKLSEAEAGAAAYRAEDCDGLIAVGGGSAIDTAKCIRRQIGGTVEGTAAVPFAAMPTTAGTGSESTRFAVIYENGEKRSLSGDELLPDLALLIPELLASLPIYQRKCTLLDALCQATESYWSRSSTEESRELSRQAIELILPNIATYVSGEVSADEVILKASNLAGQAISVTTTTAPHAMSYKLTSKYGIPHGLAVALTLPGVLRAMVSGSGECTDPRGRAFLEARLNELAELYGYSEPMKWAEGFSALLSQLSLKAPEITAEAAEELALSVNAERLKNNPVLLSIEELRAIYAEL